MNIQNCNREVVAFVIERYQEISKFDNFYFLVIWFVCWLFFNVFYWIISEEYTNHNQSHLIVVFKNLFPIVDMLLAVIVICLCYHFNNKIQDFLGQILSCAGEKLVFKKVLFYIFMWFFIFLLLKGLMSIIYFFIDNGNAIKNRAVMKYFTPDYGWNLFYSIILWLIAIISFDFSSLKIIEWIFLGIPD